MTEKAYICKACLDKISHDMEIYTVLVLANKCDLCGQERASSDLLMVSKKTIDYYKNADGRE